MVWQVAEHFSVTVRAVYALLWAVNPADEGPSWG
jgi:hypothetical protein